MNQLFKNIFDMPDNHVYVYNNISFYLSFQLLSAFLRLET